MRLILIEMKMGWRWFGFSIRCSRQNQGSKLSVNFSSNNTAFNKALKIRTCFCNYYYKHFAGFFFMNSSNKKNKNDLTSKNKGLITWCPEFRCLSVIRSSICSVVCDPISNQISRSSLINRFLPVKSIIFKWLWDLNEPITRRTLDGRSEWHKICNHTNHQTKIQINS